MWTILRSEIWAAQGLISDGMFGRKEPVDTFCDFLSSTSFCKVTMLPLLLLGTFLLRSSAPSGVAPKARLPLLVVMMKSPVQDVVAQSICRSGEFVLV